MTRDEIAQAMNDTAGSDWGTESHFQRFAAVLKDQMIRDGWRQCAVGQKATQFCGELEEALKGEREEIKQLRAERNTAQANLASIQIGWENWRVTHSTAFKDTEIQRLREEIEAEREACAKVCDEIGGRDSDSHAWDAAAAIRARGET
jgi:hypothetical protein